MSEKLLRIRVIRNGLVESDKTYGPQTITYGWTPEATILHLQEYGYLGFTSWDMDDNKLFTHDGENWQIHKARGMKVMLKWSDVHCWSYKYQEGPDSQIIPTNDILGGMILLTGKDGNYVCVQFQLVESAAT